MSGRDLILARGSVTVIRSSSLAAFDDVRQERDSMLVEVPDDATTEQIATIVAAARRGG